MESKGKNLEDAANKSFEELECVYGEDGQVVRYRPLRGIINIWYPGSIPEGFGV